MSSLSNRSKLPTHGKALVLSSRPTGRVTTEHFAWRDIEVPPLQTGQVLVETLYLSVDPTNRIWMSDRPGYMPPVPLGEVMRAGGLGRVVASKTPFLRPGQLVAGLLGWQDIQVAQAATLSPINPLPDVPLSLYLGPLGLTGLTAWFGMQHIGAPKAGETVVVSAAAGAVGSVAGQLARIAGARVVGLAGSKDKCEWLTQHAGFNAALNYHDYTAAELSAALRETCPKGIDVYFENVGGVILEAVLPLLNNGARIPLCGLIAHYNDNEPVTGPRGFEQLLMKRVKMQGFIILDYAAEFAAALEQLAPLVVSGQIRYQETILDGGLGKMVDAVNMLFDGQNRGKLCVRMPAAAQPA